MSMAFLFEVRPNFEPVFFRPGLKLQPEPNPINTPTLYLWDPEGSHKHKCGADPKNLQECLFLAFFCIFGNRISAKSAKVIAHFGGTWVPGGLSSAEPVSFLPFVQVPRQFPPGVLKQRPGGDAGGAAGGHGTGLESWHLN